MKPTLVIMAAGLGSRYGGLKQIDPIGPDGEILIEFAISDMIAFGGEKIICIISEATRHDFETMIVEKYREQIEIQLVIQSCENTLGEKNPERTKPWGTGHAIWCAREAIIGSFIVINADDFYGRDALFEAYDFLIKTQEPQKHCIVTCPLNKMLSDYGTVSRGICSTNDNKLITILEHTKVRRKQDKTIVHTCQDGTEVLLAEDAPANMNLFGFQKDFITILDREMTKFFAEFHNELTREFFLPSVVMEMIQHHEGEVCVLPSTSEWFGMTNKEDRAEAVQKIQNYLKKHSNV